MGYERVGERVRERMLARGYQKEDGEPDVQRFCWDFRFTTQLLYNWLNNKGVPFKDLIRLCVALDCSAEWLLTGNERKKATPRQGRGNAKSLLLALTVGAAALWPSVAPTPPAGADALQGPSYRKSRDWPVAA